MRHHRIFAALYDRLLAVVEREGLSAARANLLGDVRGRVLEIGAGTGLNLRHYPADVTDLVLLEPDRFMAARLRDRIAADPPPMPVTVVDSPAERLPFDDASFDRVVSTLVLCTVDDPDRTIAEMSRVLRPGGELVCLEHVRSQSSARLARWQDLLDGPWGWFAGGCHPNRDTERALRSSGLDVKRLDHGEMPKPAGPVVRPLIYGSLSRR